MSQILGALGGVSDIVGGIVGGSQAANALKDANQQALTNAQGQYTTDTANLSPYMSTGSAYSNALTSQLGSLSQGYNPTVAQLDATPGYQFETQQGLDATQNGFAAQGLGVSGASMAGAANYATQAANSTYQSLANVYNQNRDTTANILTSGANMGLNAATQLGSMGNSLTSMENNAILGMGNAEAQGDMAPYEGISQGMSQMAGSTSGSGGLSTSALLGML